MNRRHLVDIPPPSAETFRAGIRHPNLWLWDAWTEYCDGSLFLFTLALARRNKAGQPITPGERNDYPFHIRRFVSDDHAISWRDCGVYLEPSDAAGGVMAHNVWSGSAMLSGELLLFGFTGIRQPEPDRPFMQSICVLPAPADGAPPAPANTIAISDPEADYDDIRAKGYYLGARETLGGKGGEEGGPILAWRDPYFLLRDDGSIDAFWAAKTGPASPAVAHARLTPAPDGFTTALLAPITLPDGDEYTQAEVPKVYRAPAGDGYLLLLSTCNRLQEDQPDSQVSKELRLYRAKTPEGPWRPYRRDSAIIPDADNLFGGSFASINEKTCAATLIAPYSEMAEPDRQLTFAPPVTVDLNKTEAPMLRAAGNS